MNIGRKSHSVSGRCKTQLHEFVWVDTSMEKRVSKAIFKSRACELFRQVEMLGETVVVTDRGQPTIEIRPYRNKQENPLELLRASIVHFNMKHLPLPAALEPEEG